MWLTPNPFSFFLANNLLAPNQSGIKPGNSCNELQSIIHELYSSFDDGFEVRSVSLDISKAFDKVWHEGIIFKLKQNGILDDLLNMLSDFLRNRKQGARLNGQSSSCTNVNVGVPQGFTLGPLLFLIYINDLSDGLSSTTCWWYFSIFICTRDKYICYWIQKRPEQNQWLGLSIENDFQSRS